MPEGKEHNRNWKVMWETYEKLIEKSCSLSPETSTMPMTKWLSGNQSGFCYRHTAGYTWKNGCQVVLWREARHTNASTITCFFIFETRMILELAKENQLHRHGSWKHNTQLHTESPLRSPQSRSPLCPEFRLQTPPKHSGHPIRSPHWDVGGFFWSLSHTYLIGGWWYHPEKYESQIRSSSQLLGKIKTCSKPPTSYWWDDLKQITGRYVRQFSTLTDRRSITVDSSGF